MCEVTRQRLGSSPYYSLAREGCATLIGIPPIPPLDLSWDGQMLGATATTAALCTVMFNLFILTRL
jgi:hypothetical protein